MFRSIAGLKLASLAFAAASLCAPAVMAAEKPAAKAVQSAPEPALWKIENGKSTVYLLGSIHVLPQDFKWHTPVIDKAIDSADDFAFEASLSHDLSEITNFYDKNGYLPRGQTLHSKLSPEALKKYKQLIADMRIDPDKVDYLQPWYASELISGAYGARHSNLHLVSGVDVSLMKYAIEHKKRLSYLETVQEHWGVLPTVDQGQEIKAFEKMLNDLDSDVKKLEPMIAAWSQGDLDKVETLSDDQDAVEKNALLFNRNAKWIPEIEAMLKDGKTHLVTAGVAHFSGKGSVVDRLCAKGWNVQRLQTGATVPPQACNIGSMLRVTSLN
jgi:hypothetical protein